MRRSAWMSGVAAVVLCGVAAGLAPAMKHVVMLKNGKGEDAGKVTFTQKAGGPVKMKIELKNLPTGMHAVHIHQNATCDAPDFKGAGGHFNPEKKQHGFENPMGHHAGDLPQNVTVGENHMGEATVEMKDISLDKAAENSIFANGGTSVVVHEKADDMKTDPTGNAGNRIACGVVQ